MLPVPGSPARGRDSTQLSDFEIQGNCHTLLFPFDHTGVRVDEIYAYLAGAGLAPATAAWVALDAARRPPTPPYIPLHPITSPQRWTALYDAPYIPL